MKNKKIYSVLFISHEMSATGAPRSLLRMCRVGQRLGYAPTVWTMWDGPLKAEFEQSGIPVELVPIEETVWPERLAKIEEFDLAVCNTAVTARFVRVCCQRIPTVWYIREAANISDVLAASPPETAYMLRHSRDIVCISEYARQALAPYADEPIRVLRNAVEDESDKSLHRVPGSGETVRFAQFGTLEPRKGCDVLLEAFRTLPKELRPRAELLLAGAGGETDFGAALLRRAEETPGVEYLGVVPGKERIAALSRADVVVVASRDEAGSLTALEGAMLGKPLIVTENVGAKYMVKRGNGRVVPAGDAGALRDAMAEFLRHPRRLAFMGWISRRRYERLAGMEQYTRRMKTLFSLSERKGTEKFLRERERNVAVFGEETVGP
ncbi:MAG: glycosyltransferase family 4 protein [Oscillospiraceae bacterium]|nr:glycosyltransferase family 4 protein [Oscillospiraceae bacterium]